MRTRPENLLLLLLFGGFVLTQHDKFPTWFSYALMLLVLVVARLLAPEWFEEGWFVKFWVACVAVAGFGLLLEASQLVLG